VESHVSQKRRDVGHPSVVYGFTFQARRGGSRGIPRLAKAARHGAPVGGLGGWQLGSRAKSTATDGGVRPTQAGVGPFAGVFLQVRRPSEELCRIGTRGADFPFWCCL
jgi:hypothetical protein